MILGQFNSKNIVALPNYGLRDLQITASDTVSASVSPWTKQANIYDWQAQWWSAQLNLPTMKREQIAPWIAYLLELKGMAASTLLGNILEAEPLGSFTSKNLVPDSGLASAWTFWGGAAPSAYWSIVANEYGAASGFSIASGDSAVATSGPINVIPGQTYTLSAYANLSAITAAGAGGPPAVEFQYAGAFIPLTPAMGTSGRYSTTFTVPENITQGTIWVSLQGSTGSGPGIFAGFQLEQGSVMTAYATSSFLYLANAGESGSSIAVNGFPASTENLLLPADNMQIGYRLYKVMEPVTSNGSGQATISIYPYLRDAPAQNTLVQWQMCCGLFRLPKNDRSWSASAVAQWGIHALNFVEDL